MPQLKIMIEIFDPKCGKPVLRVKFEFMARFITWLFPRFDFNKEGEGWS